MAGIYNRDGINYGGLIGSALQNRLSNIQRQAEYDKNLGSLWGGFGQRTGGYYGTALNTMGQREFQEQEALKRAQEAALEAERNRKFQEAQQLKQIAANKELAMINAGVSNANKESEAQERLEKLLIQKGNLEANGMDTRDIDVSIARIYRDYPNLAGTENSEQWDPTQSVQYKLAQYGDYNAKDNTGEELFEAWNNLMGFKTPEAVKALAKIDKEIQKRDKADELNKQMQNEIDAFKGNLTDKLINAGYTREEAGGVIRLRDRTGRIVKSVGKNGKPVKEDDDWS